ncbi:pseudouridine synthase [Pelagophyceae sp. CCMP2097]|nr:pseudouridine synthase [Pelagophyceae sp. CCMP2097]
MAFLQGARRLFSANTTAFAKPAASAASAKAAAPEMFRLNRLLALSGTCSRREADTYIAAKRVKIDGVVATMGMQGRRESKITLDGTPLTMPRTPKIFLAYKKSGELVTREGSDQRLSIFTRLKLGRHVMPVGRLDLLSEGLIVLTTCGSLSRALEHPKIGNVERSYRVKVNGIMTPNKIAAMRKGMLVDKIRYKPLTVIVEQASANRSTLVIKCTEGKNRMIRKIMDHLRLRTSRLIRIAFGPFSVEQLKDKNNVMQVPVPASLRQYATFKTDAPRAAPIRLSPEERAAAGRATYDAGDDGDNDDADAAPAPRDLSVAKPRPEKAALKGPRRPMKTTVPVLSAKRVKIKRGAATVRIGATGDGRPRRAAPSKGHKPMRQHPSQR